jgi:hypothetical protein
MEKGKYLYKGDQEMCLSLMNFFTDWQDWRASIKETIDDARVIDPSDEHVLGVMEDMVDFMAERVCPGSAQDELMAEMWKKASPEERRTMAALMLKLIDSSDSPDSTSVWGDDVDARTK